MRVNPSPIAHSDTIDAVRSEHDLRLLPCPEPMRRALAIADNLDVGESARVITPIFPGPLLGLLAERGLLTQISTLSDGGVCVLIHCPDRDGQAVT